MLRNTIGTFWIVLWALPGTTQAVAQTASIPTSGTSFPANPASALKPNLTGHKGVLSTGQVSASQEIAQDVATPTPLLTAGIPSQQTAGTVLSATVSLANIGGDDATAVQVSVATLGTLAADSTALPVIVGDIAAGASLPVTLNFSTDTLAAGTDYVLTVTGAYQFLDSMVPFTVSALLTYAAPDPFQAPANPINVTPVLDIAHSATQTIAASQGGTISATGADGSVFTLTIPANALLSDETITMAPLSSVSGLPVSGGLLAAVQLSPEGLELVQAATLMIQPAVSVPVDQQIAFGYHASGKELYLQPLGLTSSITIALTHFSTDGVGMGMPVNPGLPTTPADRLEQLQEAGNRLRRCQLLGDANCGGLSQQDFDNLQDVYAQAYYNEVLTPELQAAETDDSKALGAIYDAFAWEQLLAVTGRDLSSEPIATEIAFISQLVPTILTNAYNQAYGRCQGDTQSTDRISEGVRMLWAQTSLTSFGSSFRPLPITSCLTPLAIDIDSTVGQSGAPPPPIATYQSHVTARGIQLQFDPAGSVYRGSGPLTYVSFSFSTQWPQGLADCSMGSGHSGSMSVIGKFDLNLVSGNELAVLKGGTPLVHVLLNPDVTETIQIGSLIDGKCDGTGPAPTTSPGLYGAGLMDSHILYYDDPSGPSPYLIFLNSTFPFVFSFPLTSLSENSILTLRTL